MSYFLGIDGGGSQTRALLASEEGAVIHFATEGASNLNFTDESTVEQSLTNLLEQMSKCVAIHDIHACIGLAGASSATNQRLLQEMIGKWGLGSYHIVTDAEIALANAIEHGAHILLIVGTGSVCFGQTPSGEIVRTGGWGALIDDAGSGSWIGTKALALAVRQRDGRRSPTELQKVTWEALGVTDEQSIVDRIYNPAISRTDLASLAPQVIKLAQQDEADALNILNEAVDELVQLVKATTSKIPLTRPKLALHGGIIENDNYVRSKLQEALHNWDITTPETPPVLAATRQAYRKQLGENKAWESQLKSNYRKFNAD